mmetsp:Transcript_14497/g.22625  ORF Transcript_14497/g.22625 Transcript_14497/m.22625 type:complete len:219 (-) Transcript_14497:1452-2108(-)
MPEIVRSKIGPILSEEGFGLLVRAPISHEETFDFLRGIGMRMILPQLHLNTLHHNPRIGFQGNDEIKQRELRIVGTRKSNGAIRLLLEGFLDELDGLRNGCNLLIHSDHHQLLWATVWKIENPKRFGGRAVNHPRHHHRYCNTDSEFPLKTVVLKGQTNCTVDITQEMIQFTFVCLGEKSTGIAQWPDRNVIPIKICVPAVMYKGIALNSITKLLEEF